MLSLFDTHRNLERYFDRERDLDLIVAIDEARSHYEAERIAAMAHQRLLERAKRDRRERRGHSLLHRHTSRQHGSTEPRIS